MQGQQRLVFRLDNTGGAEISHVELELARQPGPVKRLPLRDDGMTELDQPADGVWVGVDTGPYTSLVRARLRIDTPQGSQLAWEGVLSVPDRESDGAAWTLQNRPGGIVARPVAAMPAGDAVGGLSSSYPLGGATFWGVLLLAWVTASILLSRRRPA